jgi:hypothetical protein
MRIMAHLSIDRSDVGGDIFSELVAIFPQGIRRANAIIFSATMMADDPVLVQLQRTLAESGFIPWEDTSRGRIRSREYSFDLRRHYDQADIQAASMLETGFTFDHPPTKCEYSNEKGELILKRHPNRDISYAISSCFTIVGDHVRRVMEEEGFAKDAVFLPTEKLERPQVPCWELRSTRTLPPVSPTMTIFEEDGRPFEGNYERQCIRREGLFHRMAELHYRASDIQAMEPFDLAHTKERFGECPFDKYRPLIVSSRFYDMCRRHGFKGGFTPVRIDP